MHLPLKWKMRTNKISMDKGAIYFEFSNGYTIAMDRFVYDTKDINGNYGYMRSFIDSMTDGGRNTIVKMYYKSYDITPLSVDSTTVWVDMLPLINNFSGDLLYITAFLSREINKIDITTIRSVEYIDRNNVVHTINKYDGTITNGNSLGPIILPVKDEDLISIKRYSIDSPNEINVLHMNDLHIECKDTANDLTNSLVWVGGVFLPHTHINNRIITVKDGKYFCKSVIVGYGGNETLIRQAGEPATIDDGYRNLSSRVMAWDYDVKIFKWRNVKIEPWKYPVVADYSGYVVDTANGETYVIDYVSSLRFDVDVHENHLIMVNGVVVNRDDYTIDGKVIHFDKIKLKNKILTLVNDAIKEGLNIEVAVESIIPQGGDYSLVLFSHITAGKTIELLRSNTCDKNYPYRYHVRFPEINIGDMVLVDGVFDRYIMEDRNVIRYHLTDYIAKYTDKNMMSYSNIERVWFKEN